MNDGKPIPQPYNRAKLLAQLTGAATLAAGCLLFGQGTSELGTLPAPSSDGQILTGTATAPVWSGSGLTWSSNILTATAFAGTGGSSPGSQGASAWAAGAGVLRSGTQIRTDGTGAASLQTAGGATIANGLIVSAGTSALQAVTCTTLTAVNAATQDGIQLLGRAGGTSSYIGSFTPTTLTASRTWTGPDLTGTLALLEGAQTFTGLKNYSISTDAQTALLQFTKRSAGGTQQYKATYNSTGAGTAFFLQFLDPADAFYWNAAWYDYTNKRVGINDNTTPETALHAIGDILASGVSGHTVTSRYSTTGDAIRLRGRVGGTSSYIGTFSPTTLSASQTWTMPNATGTVALLSLAQTWTAAQTISGVSLLGTGGSSPGSQGATAYELAAGVIRSGTQLRTDGTGAASIQTAGGITMAGALSGVTTLGASGTVTLAHSGSTGNAIVLSPTCTSLNGQAVFSQPIMSFAANSANRSRGWALDFRTASGSSFDLTNALIADNCVASVGFVHQGTGAIADFAGLNLNLANNSTGVIATWRGIRVNASALGSTVNYIGIDLQAVSTASGQTYGLQIGSMTGGTDARAIVTGSGRVTFGDTTDASAIGTAGFVHAGGASIAKNLWVGGTAGNYINIANATGELRINGTKVMGAQGAAVPDAAGGATVDTEARAAINAALARMRAHGSIAT